MKLRRFRKESPDKFREIERGFDFDVVNMDCEKCRRMMQIGAINWQPAAYGYPHNFEPYEPYDRTDVYPTDRPITVMCRRCDKPIIRFIVETIR